MKKSKIILLMLLISLVTFGKSYYISATHPNADDTNPGDNPAGPWQTLNFSKWGSSRTDGDTLHVAAGTYTYGTTAGANIVKSIVIIGDDKSTVIIQGVDDATFNSKAITGNAGNVKFAKIAALAAPFNTVKFQNMTLRNSIVKSSPYDGGFFEILAGNTLVLENMIVERTYFPGRYGGAINSKGSLQCTDVTFQNCVAMQGGVIFSNTTAKDFMFKRCKFLNNSTQENTTAGYKLGAAISMGSNGAVDATFDDCLFNSNICDHSTGTTDYSKKPEGGALMIRLLSPSSTFRVNIKNSAFINNFAYRDGAAILTSVPSTSTSATTLDINITNTTFADNKISVDSDIDGTTLILANNAAYTGNFTLVNNTFLNNTINKASQKSVVIPDVKFNIALINNVFQDAPTQGYSLVVNGPTDDSQGNFTSLNGQGNVGDKLGGSIFKTTGWSSYDWGTNPTLKNVREKYSNDVKFAGSTVLNANGIPYYTFESGSVLANGGVNSFLFNDNEIIPTKDITGASVKNGTKDVGVWESDFVSAVRNIKEYKTLAYPNPFTEVLNIKDDYTSLEIFDITGKLVLKVNKTNTIDTDNLNAGTYILKATSINNETFHQVILKR